MEILTSFRAVGTDQFEFLRLLGQGGYAKVFLVRKKATGKLFAMKVMRKDFIIEANMKEYIEKEKDVLNTADNPFLM